MSAKQLYPDRFGDWLLYEDGPYPKIPAEDDCSTANGLWTSSTGSAEMVAGDGTEAKTLWFFRCA